jgi:hypothetical protein
VYILGACPLKVFHTALNNMAEHVLFM